MTAATTVKQGVSTYDHFTLASVNLLFDLEFYEDVFGARLLPRSTGRHRQKGERPPFVNFAVKTLKQGRCPIMFFDVSGSVWGLFLQLDYLPDPERMQQGPRHGMSVPKAQFEAAIKELGELGIAVDGPYEHEAKSRIAQSVYFKDPSGNSLELCVERTPGPVPVNTEGRIPVSRLVHLALDVTDLSRAEDLYGDALGMQFAYRGTTVDGLQKSVLHLPDGHVVTLQLVDKLTQRMAWKTLGKIHAAFTVEEEDWQDTEARLLARGHELLPDFVRGDQVRLDDQKSIYFKDSDNNLIQLFTPKTFGA